MYCISENYVPVRPYTKSMFMCTLVYFNQALKQGMVYSCILKPGTQTRHTNQAHKPGIQTRHTNQVYRPGTQTGMQTRHTNRAHKPDILHLILLHELFNTSKALLSYDDQENNYTEKYIATHIPAHASRLASSPDYPFPFSLYTSFTHIYVAKFILFSRKCRTSFSQGGQ